MDRDRSYDLDDRFNRATLLRSVRRMVVKVGTRILSGDDSSLDVAFVDGLMAQVAEVRSKGVEVAIVSSGAVGAGMGTLGLKTRPTKLDVLQAMAAVGQSVLMRHYDHAAAPHGMRVAQVLLSVADIRQKDGYKNVRNAFSALFRLGAVPIVNENDSVAVEELRFGDNDSLSAHVTNLIGAQLLAILTDIEGLYEGNPNQTPRPPLIRTVYTINRTVEALCGRSTSGAGIGGMRTKVGAAKMLAASGAPTIIAHGRQVRLVELLAGRPDGTLFLPQADREGMKVHYQWLLSIKPTGKLVVDDGAAKALVERRMSLLPSGVRRVYGRFAQGDSVSIHRLGWGEIARGIVKYSAEDVRKLAGRHSREIADVLGYNYGDEVIHRDNMVMITNGMVLDEAPLGRGARKKLPGKPN